MFAAELSLEVGPELLQNIPGHVDADLNAELRDRVVRGPVVRVIRIGDRHRRRVACDFGEVELRSAGIALGDENSAHCVADAGEPTARSAPEVARILMEYSGEDGLGHVIADQEIAI